jgi:cadmium resistance protein CadD (predicted permease)
MNGLMSAIGIAVAVYASTNIDNLVVLSLFFADRQLRPRLIVVGHFLGAAVVVAVSVVIGLGALALPTGYVALLGVLPLTLGVRRLISLWSEGNPKKSPDEASDATVILGEGAAIEKRTHSQLLAVAAVGIANSGDNLAAYVALFTRSPEAIPLYVLSFALLTAIWCAAGYWFASRRMVGDYVRRAGRLAFPFVMIALAIWILSGLRVLVR